MAKRKHKGIKEEDFILKPDLSITFRGKASLKRSEETGIPLEDEKAIASLEDNGNRKEVNAELATLYARTKLHPDKRITYPDSVALKKRPAIIPVYMRYAAAAAILLLFSIGAWFIFNPGTIPEREEFQLALLKSTSNKIEIQHKVLVSLSVRENIDNQVYNTVREEVQLDRMSVERGLEIKSSGALASSMPVLLIRPVPSLQPANSEQEYLAENYETPKKGLIGKIFSGLFGRIKAPAAGNETEVDETSGDGFLWNVAQLGMKGVNVLGDHDYTLVRDYNQKGNVKGLIVLEE